MQCSGQDNSLNHASAFIFNNFSNSLITLAFGAQSDQGEDSLNTKKQHE